MEKCQCSNPEATTENILNRNLYSGISQQKVVNRCNEIQLVWWSDWTQAVFDAYMQNIKKCASVKLTWHSDRSFQHTGKVFQNMLKVQEMIYVQGW